jgi:hypothetical protein
MVDAGVDDPAVLRDYGAFSKSNAGSYDLDLSLSRRRLPAQYQ